MLPHRIFCHWCVCVRARVGVCLYRSATHRSKDIYWSWYYGSYICESSLLFSFFAAAVCVVRETIAYLKEKKHTHTEYSSIVGNK